MNSFSNVFCEYFLEPNAQPLYKLYIHRKNLESSTIADRVIDRCGSSFFGSEAFSRKFLFSWQSDYKMCLESNFPHNWLGIGGSC